MNTDSEKNGDTAKFAPAVEVSRMTSIPGHPRIRMQQEMDSFLIEDLCTPELDGISNWLWLISTPSHTNVTALHRQRLRGRDIVVMEDPGLHLVWHRGSIYVKPIPRYLLEQDSRRRLSESTKIGDKRISTLPAAIRGFLRTYSLLIRHESDFRLAQSDELRLLPDDIDWETFNNFIFEYQNLESDCVSPRYQNFGELRFSRIALLVKVLLFKWHYRYTHGTYKDYLENFYAPLLFVFATVSVVLNAMQVTLASDQLGLGQEWQPFWKAARGFALFTMVITIILFAVLVLLLCRKMLAEVIYAVKAQVRGRLSRRGGRRQRAAAV